MLRYELNIRKLDKVIYWFACNSKDEQVSIHALMKLMFFADVDHINKHYLPICGGHYWALKYGPIHSQAYNYLKGILPIADELDNFSPSIKLQDKIVIAINNISDNKPLLSQANIESLQNSIDNHRDKSFKELTYESHEHKAWLNAWEKLSMQNSSSQSIEMQWEDFFDNIDATTLQDLKEDAPFLAL